MIFVQIRKQSFLGFITVCQNTDQLQKKTQGVVINSDRMSKQQLVAKNGVVAVYFISIYLSINQSIYLN